MFPLDHTTILAFLQGKDLNKEGIFCYKTLKK